MNLYCLFAMITLLEMSSAVVIKWFSFEQEIQNTTVITTSTTILTASTISTSQIASTQETHMSPTNSSPASEITKDADMSVEKQHETCTATLLQFAKLTLGPTRTIHPITRVETVYVDCEGCDTLVTKNIGGHGPVVFVKTTVINIMPTTTTTYKCSSTKNVN
ncbi:hypothetical protein HI914_03954 [Erysiphe necator]|nr:hypothetical protein HI914_03954 [Erysiphe necator]